jgi:hypothetical protein
MVVKSSPYLFVMKITETQLRSIIRQEIVRKTSLSEAGPTDSGKTDSGKIDTSGSIDSVAAAIAKKLGRDDLKGALITAIKKRKGGKEAADLASTDKTALADAFLELIFANPDEVSRVAAELKKIVPKS